MVSGAKPQANLDVRGEAGAGGDGCSVDGVHILGFQMDSVHIADPWGCKFMFANIHWPVRVPETAFVQHVAGTMR
jgi:hypothetical protein